MGEIKYPNRKRQIIDFEGMQFGKVAPTDIDGLIEYRNRAYVFFEVKYRDTEIKYGQRLALERLVLDAKAAGKIAMAMLVRHEVANPRENVLVAGCPVDRLFLSTSMHWRSPKKPVTVKQCVEEFFEYFA